MKLLNAIIYGAVLASAAAAHAQTARREPVIDMHLHAMWVPNAVNCDGTLQEFKPRDSLSAFAESDVRSTCNHILQAPATREAYEAAVLKNLVDLNIVYAATSGFPDMTERWHEKFPDRIIPGVFGSPANLRVQQVRELIKSGKVKIIGEIGAQYDGIAPDHPLMEPLYDLAEEMDVPIAIHVGLGAPAAHYVGQAGYMVSASNPVLLEPVLRRHPRLRIQVMHAAWPMADAMVAMMYSHPQIYVDTGIIDWGIPRAEFYAHLKRLVDAGFGNRIMYGSDQFFFPDAMKTSIEAIEQAPFLTAKQKRDILYNNAARFLRLDKPQG